jgi:hypothetical protein
MTAWWSACCESIRDSQPEAQDAISGSSAPPVPSSTPSSSSATSVRTRPRAVPTSGVAWLG